MTRPALLDLFSGAGGAARGYQQAGFYVVGVDIKPQPRYAGDEFVQADALEYVAENGHRFDAIHASPPCQGYSRTRHLPWVKGKEHPLLINPTREALELIGRPWVIENVMDARLPAGWLCGAMFGLPFYRHRAFETSFFWMQPGHPNHELVLSPGRMFGSRLRESHRRMELDWMTLEEQAQAIPPVFTEYIGRCLRAEFRPARGQD